MARLIGLASAALGVALLFVAALFAGEPARDPPKSEDARTAPTAAAQELPQFSALDVNADTMISAQEAQLHARLAAIFAECDADKNGALSTWEFAEARSKLDK